MDTFLDVLAVVLVIGSLLVTAWGVIQSPVETKD